MLYIYTLLDMATIVIRSMPINEKLDQTNYDTWSLQVQFVLNKRDMADFLTTSMSAPIEKYEQGKDVTVGDQHQDKLKAYQIWSKKDQFASYTERIWALSYY